MLPIPAWRQQTDNCWVLWLACQGCPSVPPSLHWAPAPAPSTLVLFPTKVEAAVANEHAYTREGLEPAQQCGSNPSSPHPASNQGVYTWGKSRTSLEVQLQALRNLAMPPTKAEIAITLSRNPPPLGLLLQSLEPQTLPHRAVTATEPRRSPGCTWIWL